MVGKLCGNFSRSDRMEIPIYLNLIQNQKLAHEVRLLFRYCLAIICNVTFVALASGAESVDFAREVQPILQSRCMECHGPNDQSSGLRLDRRSSMLRGGDLGEPTIVPGKPTESFLLTVIRGDHDDKHRMPPEGKPLSAQQTETLRRWILEGASWPGQMDVTAEDIDSDLWSLQPIQPGASQHSLLASIIDDHIESKLKASGLSMSAPADSVTLLRRVSLVLTGLPPTPEEHTAYVSDPDGPDAAYEKAVDRLLASPRYGERWAPHWLDVIRWAETVGFETNAERSSAWPYRDWVIDSLNQDKPYDRFLFEQLAGDTTAQDAALGFLVAGPANLPGQIGRDEEAMRQARQDELDEVVRTVSEGMFGLTVGCARCHNHKFDPILQSDYYAMQAIFAGLTYGDRRLRGAMNDQWTERIPEVRKQLDDQLNESDLLRDRLKLMPALDNLHTDAFAPVTAQAIRMEIAATGDDKAPSLYEFEAWTHADADNASSHNVALASLGATASASSYELANQTRHFDNLIDGSSDRRQAFPWVARETGPAWIQIDFAKPELIDRVVWDRGSSMPAEYVFMVLENDNDQWRVMADASERWLREDDTRKANDIHLPGLSRDEIESIVNVNAKLRASRAELSRLSSGPKVFAASFSSSPDPTWMLHRGDPMNRRDVVVPAIPRILGDLDLSDDEPEPNRRVALAKHLTRPDHPLTSRVIVNRVWQHHFGEGLVDTPSDFGEMGSKPTHPELLDQLSTGFVRGGWSLKKLHRQIVSSQTFRQSNRPREDALLIDADSRLLWRYPARRLEAEAIRDSVLQTSGKLNLQMGGAGFNLFKQRGGLADYVAIETFDEKGWRRMVYAHKIRMQSVDIFGSFDCPDAGQMNPKRTRSITPTQSLSMFNSPFVLQQADFFADRVRGEVGDSANAQVWQAFMLALSRPPSDAEQVPMEQLVDQDGLASLCRVLFNSSEFLYIP